PIVRGAPYVDEMIRKRLFADMLARRRSSRAQIMEELARDGRLEIEGNFLGRRLCDEMGGIGLPAEVAFARPVLVTHLAGQAARQATYEALGRAYETRGAACTFEVAGAQPFWERNAMYDRYVPADLYEVTRRWLGSL